MNVFTRILKAISKGNLSLPARADKDRNMPFIGVETRKSHPQHKNEVPNTTHNVLILNDLSRDICSHEKCRCHGTSVHRSWKDRVIATINSAAEIVPCVNNGPDILFLKSSIAIIWVIPKAPGVIGMVLIRMAIGK